jgi:hypothetical protein
MLQAKQSGTSGNISRETFGQNSTKLMQINLEVLVNLSAKLALTGGGLNCLFL